MLRYPYIYTNVVGGQSSGMHSSFCNSFFKMSPNVAVESKSSSSSLYMSLYMDVGFGDTAVTAEDVKLADGNWNVETSSNQSWTYKNMLPGKKYLSIVGNTSNSKSANEIMNKTVVYRNDHTEAVIIKEIGVYGVINDMSYSNASIWNTQDGSMLACLFRKVLSNAITLQPGDIYAVTYRISLSL